VRGLVLSLFPGLDLLGRAFEATGWCVVRGPEWVMGQDIRGWHVPAGHWDGVIGGPPCQAFSTLANLVRATGKVPKFGNLIPEFERVVREAQPRWWLCENVEAAPVPDVPGYGREAFILSPRWLGDPQSRRRRFTVGGLRWMPLVYSRLPLTALESADWEPAAMAEARPVSVRIGGSGLEKRTLPHHSKRRSLEDLAELQGYPGIEERLKGTWTATGIRQAIGNGVPRIMGEAIARAIAEWQDEVPNA
jgi:DNA (cytosine-5)-methyltransferase 1